MNFSYSAKTASGEQATGIISAASFHAARTQIRAQGLFALRIEEAEVTEAGPSISLLKRSRVTRTDLLTITSQLAIMCRSGVDLADAVRSIGEQCKKPVLKEALQEVYNDISDGKSVSDAMARQSTVFGNTYIAAIRAGESAGNITGVLTRLADLLKNEIRLMSTIRGIMAYPLVLLAVSSVVTSAIILFVLPQFATVFDSMNVPAPPLTRLLLAVGAGIRSYWFVVFPALVGCIVGGLRACKTQFFKQQFDRLTLNALILKNSTRSLLAGRMFTLLGMMLNSGIPLLESLTLCRKSIRNVYFHDLIDRLEHDVTNGIGIGGALTGSEFIPSGAAQMVATAERTGDLGTVMNMVGEFYEEEGERKLRDLVKLLEPAIIVTLGVLVGGIVMAVMLPLLDVTTMKR